MNVFVRVVQAGSFAAAAAQLDVARSVVTRQVAALETHLGVKLLARSTRRLNLTAAGATYLEQCREILDRVEAVESGLVEGAADLRGPIRLSVPLSFGIRHLMPLVGDFATAHPHVSVDVDLSDRRLDLVEEGLDLAIRITGPMGDSVVARRLGVCRSVIVASPDYLARRGEPLTPDALIEHECLGYTPGLRSSWPLTIGGETVWVPVRGRIRANNGDALLDAAVRGLGITYQPTFIAAPAIEAGLLKVLLPATPPATLGIHAIFPGTRYVPSRVRALVDFLAARIGPEPWWDRPAAASAGTFPGAPDPNAAR